MLMDFVAPVLGFGGGSGDGQCSLLVPLFDIAEGCAAAGAGAYTRPPLSSTRAVSDIQHIP